MELTPNEQLEINEFSTKYPAVFRIFALIDKRADDLDRTVSQNKQEISKLKAELSKHKNTVGLHSDRI